MSNGHALLVGLKSVNPIAYSGWNGRNGCYGCELDVDNIALALSSMGYSISELKTAAATSTSVLRSLQSAAHALQKGDIFVFYYSGHGGQQPDYDGDESESHNDNKDETLVLYDRQLIDDELDGIWRTFRPGTRIVMISDSCNSGSNYRGLRRDVPLAHARPLHVGLSNGMKAQMIHYSGCRDGSESIGYRTGGVFTMAFCHGLASGADSYPSLYRHTKQQLRRQRQSQQPQYNTYGSVQDSFEQSRPFSINTGQVEIEDEIKQGLRLIPVSWLHTPLSATEQSKDESVRIGPLAAAAIGVAVGAGIQLGSQALKNLEAPAEMPEEVVCGLSISEIERRALLYASEFSPMSATNLVLGGSISIAPRGLPLVVAAFLAGVKVGSDAARK